MPNTQKPVTIMRTRPTPVGDATPISRQPCRRRPSMKDESADDHGLGFPPGRLVHRTSKTARASRRRVGFLDQTAGNMTPQTTAKTITTRRTRSNGRQARQLRLRARQRYLPTAGGSPNPASHGSVAPDLDIPGPGKAHLLSLVNQVCMQIWLASSPSSPQLARYDAAVDRESGPVCSLDGAQAVICTYIAMTARLSD